MREVLVLDLTTEGLGPQHDGPNPAMSRLPTTEVALLSLGRSTKRRDARDGIDGIHGHPRARVERRKQHLPEVICACQEYRLAGERVCGEQATKIADDGLEEGHKVLSLQ